MERLLSSFFVVLFLTLAAGAQSISREIQRTDLYSPFVFVEGRPHWDAVRAHSSCLKLFPLEHSCPYLDTISYGSRVGDNWDIFKFEINDESQSRMIDIGMHEWEDRFDVPYIEPLRKLGKGETRGVTVNTSGTRAPDGRTYGQSTVANQVNTSVDRADGGSKTDDYAPYIQVIKGHMYVVRVVQGKIDFYLLLHVDEIVRGEKVSISYKKVKTPKRVQSLK